MKCEKCGMETKSMATHRGSAVCMATEKANLMKSMGYRCAGRVRRDLQQILERITLPFEWKIEETTVYKGWLSPELWVRNTDLTDEQIRQHIEEEKKRSIYIRTRQLVDYSQKVKQLLKRERIDVEPPHLPHGAKLLVGDVVIYPLFIYEYNYSNYIAMLVVKGRNAEIVDIELYGGLKTALEKV